MFSTRASQVPQLWILGSEKIKTFTRNRDDRPRLVHSDAPPVNDSVRDSRKIRFDFRGTIQRPSSRPRSTPNAAYIVLVRHVSGTYMYARATRRSFGVRIYRTIVRTTPRFPTHFSLSTDHRDPTAISAMGNAFSRPRSRRDGHAGFASGKVGRLADERSLLRVRGKRYTHSRRIPFFREPVAGSSSQQRSR